MIPRVVAVIPAYNEEKTIASVLIRTEKQVDNVIVVDDGSKDLTGDIAKRMGATVLSHESNLGKGAALRSGVEFARKDAEFDILVTLDADMQHDPADIPRVVAPIVEGSADIVIGARPMGPDVMPRERAVGNKLFDSLSSGGVKLRDTQSGFRAYSREALGKIKFVENGMAVESQTIMDAVSAGLRIKEVPVYTTYDGIVAKRNPANHFAQVMDYLITRTIAGSPLLYLGFPGILAMILGVIAGIRVLSIFSSSHQIAAGTALIAAILIIVGSVLTSTSVLIKLLKVQAAS
ncbi:MAG: glycosyltransferase family 2 protein [Nitrososphaerota archaeon]|nr:glycosyltransferase family 2 protein [Nitrososphaerota archaeon]